MRVIQYVFNLQLAGPLGLCCFDGDGRQLKNVVNMQLETERGHPTFLTSSTWCLSHD